MKREIVSEYLTLSSLAALVGVIAGFSALAFRYLVWFFMSMFHNGGMLFGQPWADPAIFNMDPNSFYTTLGSNSLLLIIILPLGGLVVGLITTYLSPEVRGTGTSQVMEAVLTKRGRIRARVAPLKALASAITIGSGGSIGRDGSIVQIGASLGSSLAQVFRLTETPRKILLACGAAGAIAATFNAPIAGVLFAVELIILEFRTRSFIPLVVSSVFATATIGLFIPFGPKFPAEYEFVSSIELGFFILLGIIAGFVSITWVKWRYRIADFLGTLKVTPYILPALGVALTLPIVIFVPQIMGVGFSTISNTIDGELFSAGEPLYQAVSFLLLLMALKMVATGLTVSSGGSGGGLGPSMFMGAMVGASLGLVLNATYPGLTNPFGAYALVGMGALLAGATRATLTSIVLIFELTGDYKFIVPLMLACVVADGVSILLQRDTMYTGALRRKGILFEHDIERNILRTVLVGEAMTTKVDTVTEDMMVSQVSERMIATGHHGFPVLDKEGYLVGIITNADVRKAIAEGHLESPCSEVETQQLIVATPRETIEEALERMAIAGIGRLPVVSETDSRRLVGYLSRVDVIRAFRRKALEERHEVYRSRRAR